MTMPAPNSMTGKNAIPIPFLIGPAGEPSVHSDLKISVLKFTTVMIVRKPRTAGGQSTDMRLINAKVSIKRIKKTIGAPTRGSNSTWKTKKTITTNTATPSKAFSA